MYENPFAVLTAVVPPAILTNACSVLALNTSNRVARVVDRTRIVVGELVAARRGTPAYEHRVVQIRGLQRRSRLLLQALRVVYAALGGFAASALITVIGAVCAYNDWVVPFHAAAALALLVGVGAVAGLVWGCVLIVAETQLALGSVREALEEAARQPV